jgi:hypothetical protein
MLEASYNMYHNLHPSTYSSMIRVSWFSRDNQRLNNGWGDLSRPVELSHSNPHSLYQNLKNRQLIAHLICCCFRSMICKKVRLNSLRLMVQSVLLEIAGIMASFMSLLIWAVLWIMASVYFHLLAWLSGALKALFWGRCLVWSSYWVSWLFWEFRVTNRFLESLVWAQVLSSWQREVWSRLSPSWQTVISVNKHYSSLSLFICKY